MEDDGAAVLGSFASGCSRHFQTFRETKRDTSTLFVQVSLANGDIFFCEGLWITQIEDVSGCVMIHGVPARSKRAVTIREDHIICVYFDTEQPPVRGDNNREPFGFMRQQGV